MWGAPRLTISKQASVTSAAPGGSITYQINYSNDSPINVSGAVVYDTLPAKVNFVSASNGGVYNSGNRTIRWSVGDLASGSGTRQLSYVVTVSSSYSTSDPSSIVNSATITSTSTTPSSASVSTYINVPRPSITVQKTASSATVAPGGLVTFTLSYANTGNATASSVLLTDTLPAGFTYYSSNPTAGTHPSVGANGNVIWSLGSLSAGSSSSARVVARASTPFSTSYANPATNTALLDSAQTSPVSSSLTTGVNQSGKACSTYYFHNLTTNVGAGADGGTRKIANLTAPLAGATGTGYSMTATSTFAEALRFYQDPATSKEISFSGLITTNIYVDRANGQGIVISGTVYNYNTVTGSKTLIGSGSQSFLGSKKGLFQFTVNGAGTLNAGNRLLWIFSVRSNSGSIPLLFQYDGNVTNSLSSGSTFADSNGYFCYVPPANLSLEKHADRLTAQPGDTIAYTIDFSNSGVNNAASSLITETLPTGVTYKNATLNGSAATPLSISGQQVVFRVRSSDTATVGQITGGKSGVLVVNATVPTSLSSSITSLVNNVSLDSVQTTPLSASVTTPVRRPQLSMSKLASQTLLAPGDSTTYTVTVLNSGDGSATSLVVTDTLPVTAYYMYVAGSASNGGVYYGGSHALTWNLGSLAAGASQTLTYRMVAAGSGAPDGVTYLNNTARYYTPQTGVGTSNEVSVSLSTNPNLTLQKSRYPASNFAPGDIITYTLAVANDGDSDATNLWVADPIPDSTHYVMGSLKVDGVVKTDAGDSDTGRFDAVENRVIFEFTSLAAGAGRTLTFAVQVDADVPAGATLIDNTASTLASNAARKTASVQAEADAAPALSLDKTGPTSVGYPVARLAAPVSSGSVFTVDSATQLAVGYTIKINGTVVEILDINGTTVTVDGTVSGAAGDALVGSVTYSIQYRNDGDAPATGVALTDTLPAGAQWVSNSSGGVYGSGKVVWTIGSLAAGGSGLAQVTIFPRRDGVADQPGRYRRCGNHAAKRFGNHRCGRFAGDKNDDHPAGGPDVERRQRPIRDPGSEYAAFDRHRRGAHRFAARRIFPAKRGEHLRLCGPDAGDPANRRRPDAHLGRLLDSREPDACHHLYRLHQPRSGRGDVRQ